MDEAKDNCTPQELAERIGKSRKKLLSSKKACFFGFFFMLGAAFGSCLILWGYWKRHNFPEVVGQGSLLAGLLCNATAAFLIYRRASKLISELDAYLRILDSLRQFDALLSSQSGAPQYIMKTKMTISTEERKEKEP